MDSLKTLFDKKQYDLILKLTDSSKDSDSIFYRIFAFMSLGLLEDALNCIEINQKILEKDMHMLITIHIEILCMLTKFDEAFEQLNIYKEKPYVSQEVEELLNELPTYIRNEEKKLYSFKNMSDSELKKHLKSSDRNEVIVALDVVKEKDLKKFIKEIEHIMIEFPQQTIRSLALLVLVQSEYDKAVSFKCFDETMTLTPAKLNPPFINEQFDRLVKEINRVFKNPSLSKNAVQILSTYIIYIYPRLIDEDDDMIIEAIYEVSCEYLKTPIEIPLKERCKNNHLNYKQTKDLIDKINKSLEDF